MQVWIVIKDLYGPDLVTDLGGKVNHTSEIVGVFTDESDAETFRDDMVNESDLPIFPYFEEIDPSETYIDGIVESHDLICL